MCCRRHGPLALLLLLVLYVAALLLLLKLPVLDSRKRSHPQEGVGGGVGGRGGVGAGVGEGPAGGGEGGNGRVRRTITWCRTLTFLSPPRPPAALVSFPGSGNTWVRYLLQQATGVLTGSVYRDHGLRKYGFPAEGVVNGSVAVVKTHRWGPAARRPFARAVLLVREPAAALLAEFNRRSAGHVGHAAPERYRRNGGKYWQQFVRDLMGAWRAGNLDWALNFRGPCLLLPYEALVRDPGPPLRRVLRFLGLSERVPESALSCALERKEGAYRRRRRHAPFDPFTRAQREAIAREEEEVMARLRRARPSADDYAHRPTRS